MAKVFVGLSGGVDSSVTAALLKEAGHDVTGVFILGWYPDWLPCTWRDDRRDAMRVAAELDIPFVTLDASAEYKKFVIDYLSSEYAAGRTPNPDIMCNKHVKFGVFHDFVVAQGADLMATGHYARAENGELYRGDDPGKDQSYFLWTLPRAVLERTLFPLGKYKKDEVRKLAKKYELPTAAKPDSQGICFLGDVSIEQFIESVVSQKQGSVLSTDGQVIGTHTGALLYTIGERHGFTIADPHYMKTPLYVVSKDVQANTITVASALERQAQAVKTIYAGQTVWRGKSHEGNALCQYRHLQEPIACSYHHDASTQTLIVQLKEARADIACGQSCVLYDKSGLCYGGGVIDRV